jgi:hypothetical protein
MSEENDHHDLHQVNNTKMKIKMKLKWRRKRKRRRMKMKRRKMWKRKRRKRTKKRKIQMKTMPFENCGWHFEEQGKRCLFVEFEEVLIPEMAERILPPSFPQHKLKHVSQLEVFLVQISLPSVFSEMLPIL